MTNPSDDVKMILLELTTLCNAACPQCDRMDLSKYNDEVDRAELTLDFLKQSLPEYFIKNLNKVTLSGNYGEPSTARDIFPIIRWLKSINPTMTIGMHTNGGARGPSWWSELATILDHSRDYVVFAVDGLEDTNHIYRVNVRWSAVMANMKAFIAGGGIVHWDLLVFEHNEHQAQEIEALAKSMGAKWFRSKVTRRLERLPIAWLALPKGYSPPKPHSVTVGTSCHALNEKSIYVTANGLCIPCCFVGGEMFKQSSRLKEIVDFNELRLGVNEFEEILLKISKAIVEMRESYFQCKVSCGIYPDSQSTPFVDEWRTNIEFNRGSID